MDNMRTLAVQIPEELFQRLKDHLAREAERTGKRVSQKEFVLALIQQALEEADQKDADAPTPDGPPAPGEPEGA